MFDVFSRLHAVAESVSSRLKSIWDSIPWWVKVTAWFPFQGVMFWIEPVIADFLVWIMDTVIGTASGLADVSFRVLLLSALLGFLILQTGLLFLKLNRIENLLQYMATGDHVPAADGGHPVQKPPSDPGPEEGGSDGSGALVGAIAGGALGAPWGPAGVVGGAALGLIIGDELQKGEKDRDS